jgi:5-formyltetrahydrofolate cyclo-ligase
VTGDPAIQAAKVALRAAAKTERAAVSPTARQAAASAIATHGLAWLIPSAKQEAIVSGFLSFGDELDTAPLLSRLHGDGYRLCLPVMQGKGLPLIFRQWSPGDTLKTVQWGIQEPADDKPALIPDILLVPLLAFDTTGHRLGYGGGYYDRTLASLRTARLTLAIGLACDYQAVDAVPHLDYDQKLDGVLTPSGGRLFP